MTAPDPSRLLRAALLGNAAFSAGCAITLLAAASSITPHVGTPVPWLYGLGGGLGLFALWLGWQATRPQPHLLDALLTSLGDGLWVVASVAVLLLLPEVFTRTGVGLLAGVAVVVGVAGVQQLRGIARLIAEPDRRRGTRQRFEFSMEVDAPRDAMWSVVGDLGSISRYSASLAESFVRDEAEPGVGAVRQCANIQGKRWAERVIDWRPGHGFGLEFLSGAPGFPFPMKPMHGGWRLVEAGPARTQVTVWWSFTTTPPWAAVLIVPLMESGVRRDFPAVLGAMAEQARRGLPPRVASSAA